MGIVVFDQLTKYFVREFIVFGTIHPVIPGVMNLTYLRNPGAAWGILGEQGISLTVLSIVMLVLMIVFRRSFLNDTRTHKIALGLLAGGIVGNLIDRVKCGAVTDFLDFYIGTSHWPSFNVADSAICIGVAIYVVTTLLEAKNEKRKKTGDQKSDVG